MDAPSSRSGRRAAVTVGATLAMATTWTDSESVPEAPSESATFISTFAWTAPSGKKHWKLPPCGGRDVGARDELAVVGAAGVAVG